MPLESPATERFVTQPPELHEKQIRPTPSLPARPSFISGSWRCRRPIFSIASRTRGVIGRGFGQMGKCPVSLKW